MDTYNEFDNIISLNFGKNAPVTECETEDEGYDWLGFSHDWVAEYGLPDEGACTPNNWQEIVNGNIRYALPIVVDWLIQDGVADELAEVWACDEGFIPSLAETLMVRVNSSHWDGVYCDGNVAQHSIAVIDLARLATAFATALEGWR